MSETLDPRLHPVREDLAALSLKDEVDAPRYAAPVRMRVTAGVLPMRARPGAEALSHVLIYGAEVDVYETKDGLAWLQAVRDGYVGYASEEGLGPHGEAATHRVRAPLSHLYPAPDIKTEPVAALPLGAELCGEIAGEWLATAEGYAPAVHVAVAPADDWVEVAQSFEGAPYLWGGASALGIDCSGLVQAARHAAGLNCPRDADMQEAAASPIARNALQRGDLVFWRGHVGVMLDPETLLHANAHHMAVAREPLEGAIARIAAGDTGAPTSFRRFEG